MSNHPDIAGREFDWFAADRAGCVAMRRCSRLIRGADMTIETDASRIESLIEAVKLSKALWLLRDALARNPQDESLLRLAARLAAAAETKAMNLAYNKATDGSREAQEIEAIARQAREYLTC